MIKGSNGSTKKYSPGKSGSTKGTSKTLSGPAMYTKVSQATIDKIKSMGMTAALKSAPKANAEMAEGLRRMYGQRRLDAAMAANKPSRAVMARPGSTPKSNAPGAISGKSKSTTSRATSVKNAAAGAGVRGGGKYMGSGNPTLPSLAKPPKAKPVSKSTKSAAKGAGVRGGGKYMG